MLTVRHLMIAAAMAAGMLAVGAPAPAAAETTAAAEAVAQLPDGTYHVYDRYGRYMGTITIRDGKIVASDTVSVTAS